MQDDPGPGPELSPHLDNKRSQVQASPYCGGFVLSLDLSAAFDSILRIHIYHALMEAQVDCGDVALIMTWLYESCCHFKHGNVLIVESDKDACYLP